ncbi:MAG: hypothetical protein ACK5V3_16045 [Bdellovibrionales bacterium]
MTALVFILNLLISQASAETFPFDCLDLSAHPSGGQIYQELRQFQKKLSQELPELASPSTAVGYCEMLPQTHVLSFLTSEVLPLPQRCAGFTFSVESRQFAKEKALTILQHSFEALNGPQATVILNINGQSLRLPICLDILDELIGSAEKPIEDPVSEKKE